MLELGVGADIVRGIGWIFIALFSAALWFAYKRPKTRKVKVICVLGVLTLFFGPMVPGAIKQYERDQERAKAKAVFDEVCKDSGQKIYKTVDDVEGIQLLKMPQVSLGDAQVATNAFYESTGDDYVRSFLLYEYPVEKNRFRTLSSERGRPAKAKSGYRYVTLHDPVDNKFYRYSLMEDSLNLLRQEASVPLPRYAVTVDNPIIPEERAYWIARSLLKVIDTQTSEVIAEDKRYVIAYSQGRSNGDASPWLSASMCSNSRLSHRSEIRRFFVDQVLKPIQEK
jgi:hypothetical protein